MNKAEKRKIYDNLISRGMKPSEALYYIEREEAKESQKAEEKREIKDITPRERTEHKQLSAPAQKKGLKEKLTEFVVGTPEEREHKWKVKSVYKEEKKRLQVEEAKRKARLESASRTRKLERKLKASEKPRKVQITQIQPLKSTPRGSIVLQSSFAPPAAPAHRTTRKSPKRPTRKSGSMGQRLNIYKSHLF